MAEDLPDGTIGTENFVCFPREIKQLKTPEAEELRKCFKFVGPTHLVFIALDIFVYDFEILALIADIAFLWFNFQNFMMNNQITIGVHLGCILVCVLIAVSHVQRVLFEGSTL